jgi:hypothetical protein
MTKITPEKLAAFNAQLQEAQDKSISELKPYQDQFDQAKAQFEMAKGFIEDSFKQKLEAYYDQVLLDKNGQTIKNGHTITDGTETFFVVARRMQVVFGTMLFNTALICTKVKAHTKGVKTHTIGYKLTPKYTIKP